MLTGVFQIFQRSYKLMIIRKGQTGKFVLIILKTSPIQPAKRVNSCLSCLSPLPIIEYLSKVIVKSQGGKHQLQSFKLHCKGWDGCTVINVPVNWAVQVHMVNTRVNHGVQKFK